MSSGEEKIVPTILADAFAGVPAVMHVKDGRIIRIRPMIFEEGEAKPWSIKVGDKVFTPRKRTFLSPFDTAQRRRVYNPKRTMYPLKRVGFEPGGKSSTANRGKGEFVRISWDEALDIIESELKRIKKTYGNSAILTIGSGHGQTKSLNTHGLIRRVLNFWGGQTPMIRNPDSWEGWYWGAQHVWGMVPTTGIPPELDVLEDVMQNSETIVFWSYDPEQTSWESGQESSQWMLWLKELGKKMIFISPDLSYTAGTKGDKWIPIRPGTDAAMAAAIAYIWLTEGTYEKEYVKTHGVGFEKWEDYILGRDDKTPKTPDWAEKITGVEARVIRALAHQWASSVTHLAIRYAAACRVPYSTEWPRMMIFLQMMQGLGKPGVNIGSLTHSAPLDTSIKRTKNHGGELVIRFGMETKGPSDIIPKHMPENPVKQFVYQTLVPQAILNPPISWYGKWSSSPVEEQFIKKVHPMPGNSEIHMIWWDTVSQTANWNNTHKWTEAYRSPKIEFSVAEAIFLEDDALFADIVLPLATQLEREDFGSHGPPYIFDRGGDQGNNVVVYLKDAVTPVGEAKSGYEISRLVAQRLGVEKEYTEGNTIKDWIKKCYEATSLPEHISFEKFKEKGYYVFKFPDEWPRRYPFRQFRKTATGLDTPSGKIEFYSKRLAENFPDDEERPPCPRYIAEGVTHQESLTSKRAKKYPLLVESPHPRYRFHSQHDAVTWLWEIPSHKVLKNGVPYEALWMNPKDAKARGIKKNDIVRLYNERGSVLCGAYLTERMIPGVVRIPNGANYEPIEMGKMNRGSANSISPLNVTSKNSYGMAVNAFLAQVEKWEGKL